MEVGPRVDDPGGRAAFDVEARAGRVREHLGRVARRFPGLQYALTDDRATRFEFIAGCADLRTRQPVEPDTLFMAASCSKVVTAAAIQQLADAGRVSLDASLSDYFADHPYGRDVTIRQLLAHTAGVPNPLPINWLHRIDDTSFDEDRALASVLRSHPRLRFPPGSRYEYSNLGYWLLGKVIARASNSSYVQYVEDHVLAPLRIPNDELCFAITDPKKLARGYQRAWSSLGVFTRLAVKKSFREGRDGKWLRFAHVYMNGASYGGLLATARGFCAFLRGQIGGPPSTALGWRARELAGVSCFSKPGGGPGFCGNVRVYPTIGMATAWFANEMEVSERRILELSDEMDVGWFGQ